MKTLIFTICLISDLHPASDIVLNDFLADKIDTTEFSRYFSLASSRSLQYTQCIVEKVAEYQVVTTKGL